MTPLGILTMKQRITMLTAVTTILTILAIYTGQNLVQESNHWGGVKGLTTQLYGEFFEESTDLRGYLLTGDQSFLTELEKGEKEFRNTIEEAKALIKDRDILNILGKFELDEQRWHEQVVNPTIDLRKKVNAGKATNQELIEKFLASYYGSFLLSEFSIKKDSQDLLELTNKKIEAVATQSGLTLITILGVEVTVGIGLSVAISRAIDAERSMRAAQLRILLVEESSAVRTRLRNILQSLGLSIILEAEDKETATTLFERGNLDIIFLGLPLSGNSGQEFVKQVLTVNPLIKIIVSSAESSGSEDIRNLISQGIYEHIHKPLKREAVQAVVSRIGQELETTRSLKAKEGPTGSVLLEYSVHTEPEELSRTIIDIAENFDDILLLSSPGSVVYDAVFGRANVRFGGEVVTLVSGITHLVNPQPGRRLLILFDNITDMILRAGFQTCYNVIKEITKLVVRYKITAIFIMVPESIEDKELATVRSIFSNKITLKGKRK